MNKSNDKICEKYAFRWFKEKTILVVVPHQDDELCIMGGLLKKFAEVCAKVIVLYVTDGDYVFPAKIRRMEAISALKIMGIPKNNIIFLGYHDTPNWSRHHIYYDKIDGKTKNHLVAEIKACIRSRVPDAVFVCDMDYHSDHRAVSFLTEEAIGQLIKENNVYRPIICKAFAYAMSFYGKADYTAYNLKSSCISDGSELENPVYEWDKRLRLPVPYYARTKLLANNIVFQGMRKHLSQYGVRFAQRIANADQVFWMRRTDSILYQKNTCIKASSGNASALNDFLYLDSDDIMKKKGQKLSYEKGMWIPDEKDIKKEVYIQFDQIRKIDRIRFIQNPDSAQRIKKLEIQLDHYSAFELDCLKDSCMIDYEFPVRETGGCRLKILESFGEKAGISEIEIFEHQKRTLWFAKICVDNEYAYDYAAQKDYVDINIAAYDMHGEQIPLSFLRIKYMIKNDCGIVSELDKNGRVWLKGRKIQISAYVTYRGKCCRDEITISKRNCLKQGVFSILNSGILFLYSLIDRIKLKCMRIGLKVRRDR